jgi:caffeoyl-CoA O-methyltransferase
LIKLVLCACVYFEKDKIMLEHDPKLESYCIEHSERLPQILDELTQATIQRTTMPRMLSGELQGSFLRFLVGLTQAKHIVEIGTFTGYSAICMALGLPSDGLIITLESDMRMKDFHDDFFEKAGVDAKIQVIYGDAKETIKNIDGPIDLAFIDADKKGYIYYYENLIPKMKSGGLILADNVLWSGRVFDKEDQENNTIALRAFNEHVLQDRRVEPFLLYLRDGLMMIRVK